MQHQDWGDPCLGPDTLADHECTRLFELRSTATGACALQAHLHGQVFVALRRGLFFWIFHGVNAFAVKPLFVKRTYVVGI